MARIILPSWKGCVRNSTGAGKSLVCRAEIALTQPRSIAEKCFDIWGILKMSSVKSVEPGNNCFSVNHTIRCRSKLLPLGFSKIFPGSDFMII